MWFLDFVIVFNQSYNCQNSHYLGRNRVFRPFLIFLCYNSLSPIYCLRLQIWFLIFFPSLVTTYLMYATVLGPYYSTWLVQCQIKEPSIFVVFWQWQNKGYIPPISCMWRPLFWPFIEQEPQSWSIWSFFFFGCKAWINALWGNRSILMPKFKSLILCLSQNARVINWNER